MEKFGYVIGDKHPEFATLIRASPGQCTGFRIRKEEEYFPCVPACSLYLSAESVPSVVYNLHVSNDRTLFYFRVNAHKSRIKQKMPILYV